MNLSSASVRTEKEYRSGLKPFSACFSDPFLDLLLRIQLGGIAIRQAMEF